MAVPLTPKPGEPALHQAARLGDLQTIRDLLARGEDINSRWDISLDPGARPNDATPLMVIAAKLISAPL